MQTTRVLRFGGMLIGGIVSSLLLAAFILPPLLDWNEYRSNVEKAAKNLLNMELKIDGDLEIRLLPVPTVLVNDMRLLSSSKDKNIATAGSLDVALSAMALLSGNVEVSHLTLGAAKL
jgi:uncharacterized protein involved in outer membrane biogenesis